VDADDERDPSLGRVLERDVGLVARDREPTPEVAAARAPADARPCLRELKREEADGPLAEARRRQSVEDATVLDVAREMADAPPPADEPDVRTWILEICPRLHNCRARDRSVDEEAAALGRTGTSGREDERGHDRRNGRG
jgi:hypothetical protein